MAQIPDAGPELPAITPLYMAQVSTDAAPDTDRMVAVYMAQLPRS